MLWNINRLFLLVFLKLQYVSSEDCNTYLSAANTVQTFSSPGWPKPYQPNTSCFWNISGPVGSQIEIRLLNLSLEDSFDYLFIGSETTLTGSPCLSSNFTSSQNSFIVTFTSDHSNQLEGFRATYRAIFSKLQLQEDKMATPLPTSQYQCNSTTLVGNFSQVLDYTFPISGYPAEANCRWTLLAFPGMRIHLTFELFETETCCDYLLLLDGDYPARLFQGTQCPKTYRSLTSKLTLIFSSDASISKRGFRARFRGLSEITSNPVNQSQSAVSTALSRLATNEYFCDSKINSSATSQNLLEGIQSFNRSFWFFPFEQTNTFATSGSNVQTCNSSIAVENLESLLDQPNIQITPSLFEHTIQTIDELLFQSKEPVISLPKSDNFISNESSTSNTNTEVTEYVELLQEFSGNLIEEESSSNDLENQTLSFTSSLVSVQIRGVVPNITAEHEVIYPNVTFSLNNVGSSDRVTIRVPSQSVEEVARASNSTRPKFAVVLIGKLGQQDLNSNQNLSQIVSLVTSNSDVQDLSLEFEFENEKQPQKRSDIPETVVSELRQVDPVTISNKADDSGSNSKTSMQTSNNNSSTLTVTSRCHQINSEPLTYRCRGVNTLAALFSKRITFSVIVLEYFSTVGTWLSVIFLAATVIIYLAFRELRQKPTTTLTVNICMCLMFVYLIFNLGIAKVDYPITCYALAFLLHYVLLTCMLLMTVNAFQMYRAFSQVQHADFKVKPLVYVAIYVAPFLLVLLNFSISVIHKEKPFPILDDSIFAESLYRARHICWLKYPSFQWGFLLPFGLMIVFNYIVFFILLNKAVFRKSKVKSTARDQLLTDQLQNAVAMVTMMGLTWAFGFALLFPSSVAYETAMQWLFTIFNVLQGVAIFYFYCLRRDKIRNVWLCCLKKSPKSSAVITYQRQETGEASSSTGNKMQIS